MVYIEANLLDKKDNTKLILERYPGSFADPLEIPVSGKFRRVN